MEEGLQLIRNYRRELRRTLCEKVAVRRVSTRGESGLCRNRLLIKFWSLQTVSYTQTGVVRTP